MSANTELDRGAILRGLLVPASTMTITSSAPTDAAYAGAKSRRNKAPIAQLSREFDDVVTHAVDPAEIAASLEASGLNDRIVRERYQVANVFELAGILYELVPRRLKDKPRPPDPWDVPLSRHLVRGMLYALPLLPYLAALQIFSSPSDVVVLLLGSVAAMAATQGVAYLGYLLLGYGAPASAARFLRQALSFTIAGCAVLFVVACFTPLSSAAVGVTLGQLVYVVAATAVMVFREDRLLLGALLPGVAVAALTVPAHSSATFWPLTVVGLSMCLLLAVLAAYRTLEGVESAGGEARASIVREQARRAGIHALYGTATAGLVMFAVLDSIQLDGGSGSTNILGIGMLPLVLSLGVAEALLYRYRSQCAVMMLDAYDFEDFGRLSRRYLRHVLFIYTAVVLVLTAALLGLAAIDGMPTWQLLRYAAYGVLAVALLAGMLMVSCGAADSVLLILGVGVVADALVRIPAASSLDAVTARHVAVFAVVAVVLWVSAFRQLSSPLRHR